MTQADLARSVGVVARSIQRYESGREEPRAETIDRIARQLAFPAEFFSDPRPLPELPQQSLSFRAYSKLRARLRDNAVSVAQLAVGIDRVLRERFELPDLLVPDLSEYAESPVAAAQLLRDEWLLGEEPISNMIHLLEARGVRVFSLADDASDVDAFCFWHDQTPFVVLNLKKSGERGRWDAAHELAHLVLHRAIEFSSKDVEWDANLLAGEFLVPGEVLRRQLPSLVTLSTIMKLKAYWRVSAMAMVKRIKDIGHLSDWVYRSMCIQLSREGYRERELNGIDREASHLLPQMIRTGEGISVPELSRALNVEARDISPLVFGLPHVRGHLRLVE